jgi:hypothetical protein
MQEQFYAEEKLVKLHVLVCQTSLIDILFHENELSLFREDDIKNYFDVEDDESDFPEILEWWAVTEWLAERLIEEGEPVLKNEFGTWWGRTTSGQAIYMDSVIQKIAQ